MLFIFKLIAWFQAFWRGEWCTHPTRTFRKGKIYCGKCKKQIGEYPLKGKNAH